MASSRAIDGNDKEKHAIGVHLWWQYRSKLFESPERNGNQLSDSSISSGPPDLSTPLRNFVPASGDLAFPATWPFCTHWRFYLDFKPFEWIRVVIRPIPVLQTLRTTDVVPIKGSFRLSSSKVWYSRSIHTSVTKYTNQSPRWITRQQTYHDSFYFSFFLRRQLLLMSPTQTEERSHLSYRH